MTSSPLHPLYVMYFIDPGLTIDQYRNQEPKIGTGQLRQIIQLRYVCLYSWGKVGVGWGITMHLGTADSNGPIEHRPMTSD